MHICLPHHLLLCIVALMLLTQIDRAQSGFLEKLRGQHEIEIGSYNNEEKRSNNVGNDMEGQDQETKMEGRANEGDNVDKDTSLGKRGRDDSDKKEDFTPKPIPDKYKEYHANYKDKGGFKQGCRDVAPGFGGKCSESKTKK